MQKLLIIGNGMATSYLLEDLYRNGSPPYEVTVISAEAQAAAYNRILLSSLLAGDKHREELWMQDPDWYQGNDIRLYHDAPVKLINPEEREVLLCDGRRLSFDVLVIATGSKPFIPAIKGAELNGVMSFRTMDDVEHMLSHNSRQNAVIVGGGLLGLEAAHGLNSLGMNVSVIHRQDYLMNRQLNAEAATILQSQLQARGISFHLGTSVKTINALEGTQQVKSILLDKGKQLECDLLLFAAGITPNKALAESAGIDCQRGILVNQQMRTSSLDIYALGECCEFEKRTFGLIAPVRQQARVLANTLCGQDDAYHYQESPVHLKVSGIAMHASGTQEAKNAETLVLCDAESGVYRQLLIADDRLVGSLLLGDKSGSSWYDDLIMSGAAVSDFRQELIFGQAPAS